MSTQTEATLIDRLNDEADLCANEGADDIAKLLTEAAAELRRLEAECERLKRDAERLKLSRIDRECLRIGKEVERAAELLPENYEVHIELEQGSGSVYLYDPNDKRRAFNDHGDGFSYSIKAAIDAALTSKEAQS